MKRKQEEKVGQGGASGALGVCVTAWHVQVTDDAWQQ